MQSRFHFREFRPGDNASDPDFAKALFSKDAESAVARSLVREAIQNSLDARLGKDTQVRVRFAIRRGSMAAQARSVSQFLEGGWEHMNSENSGVANPPAANRAVPFLVIEDFGTTGLCGDTGAWDPFKAEKNGFYLFFRALGRSGKEGEDRGRWGVGKFVFPLASAGNCWFGLTIPKWPVKKPLLMGRMVLRTHQVNGRSYHPDGHWGVKKSNSVVMPEEDQRVIHLFKNTFSLRRIDETGLSIVVPWVAPDVTRNAIASAVISEYFLPILRNELVVEVDENGDGLTIDAQGISALAAGISSSTVRAQVNLAIRAAATSAADIFVFPETLGYDAVEWRHELIPDEVRARLLSSLEKGDPIAVSIPLMVKPKTGDQKRTYFTVFIHRQDGLGKQRPLIIREGITISEDKTAPLQDHVALVLVDHRDLAALVGDAETPAHTELQYQLVKDKYVYAGKVLSLLRKAPSEIVHALDRSSLHDDPFVLAQYFPITEPETPEQGVKRKSGTQSGKVPPPPPPKLPVSPPRYRLTRVATGFVVRGQPDAERLPEELSIRLAYDVRRGNPFKRYQPYDFRVDNGDLTIECSEANIISAQHNRLVVQPQSRSFAVSVTGFDTNRNVIVRIDARSE